MSSNTVPTPAWYADYARSFQAAEAHGFILSGDVHGLAHQSISHRGFLVGELAKRRTVIVCYDLARGFTFPDPAFRENAIVLLESAPRQPEVDPFEQALAGIGGGDEDEGVSDPFAVRGPLQALRLAERLLRADGARGKVAVLFEYAGAIFPPGPMSQKSDDQIASIVLLQTWARDSALGARNNPFFLLCNTIEELHTDLRRSSAGFKAIEIEYPALEQRFAYISWYLDQRSGRGKPIQLVDLDREELSRLTAGLSLRNVEDILLLGAKGEGVTHALAKARKDAIITAENSEVAEMLEPLRGGFGELGGMEKLIAWSRNEIINPIRTGNVEDAPKGVLLVGPPGSGKTYFVRALARELGFNAVALNLENILGSLVGESERKLKEFFSLCKKVAPVMVFLDELDQSDLSKRGNGSGNPVASNMFSAMLRFMGDETLRGKVVFVFASNRPDLIDPALKRNGRIDAIIPVQLPNAQARYGILQAQARSQNIALEEAAAQLLAAQSAKYSAADLMALIKKARKLSIGREPRQITTVEATRALKALRPSDPQLSDWYTLLAVRACTDTDLLEDEQVQLREDPKALQQQIKQLAPEETMREERD